MHSPNDRLKLKIEWDRLGEDDTKQMEFIEKHDLFNALPGFFDLKDVPIVEMEQIG